MRRIIVLIGVILFFGPSLCFSQTAEEITITTYYPSPHGVYNTLIANTVGIGTNELRERLQIGSASGGATFHDGGDKALSWNAYWDTTWRFIAGGMHASQIYHSPAGNGFLFRTSSATGAADGVIPWNINLACAIDGNVGIGTTSPGVELDVKSSDGSTNIMIENTIGAGSGGQSVINLRSNAVVWNLISRGDTDGISIRAGDFAIAQALVPRLLIDNNNGNVGIGTNQPGEKLDIVGGNGRVESGFQWLTNSDIHFKKNITTLKGCLDKIMALRGIRFDLIDDNAIVEGGGKHIGCIAQEIEKVIPEIVVTDGNGHKAVGYDKLTVVLVEAIKEQQREIDSLKSEIKNLRARLNIEP